MVSQIELTDEQLAARAAKGDQQAVADLFERYFDRVYDLALGMVRNRETAADIAQSTFVKVMESLRKSAPPRGFRAWLYTIARNTALDELRRSKRVAPMPSVTTDEGEELTLEPEAPAIWAEPEQVLSDEETVKLVWDATAGLGPDDHALLDLHLRKGLEPGEIAAVLGSTAGAVYTRLNRLRAALEASVSALLLFRRRRDCLELDALVGKYGEPALTPNLRKAINRHLEQCDQCQEQRKGFITAGALFGAVPLFVAPPEVRAGALAAALRAGVNAKPPEPGPGSGSGPGPGAPALAKAALGLAAAASLFGAGWWAAAAPTEPAGVGPNPAATISVTTFALPPVTSGAQLAIVAAATGDVTGWLVSEDGTAPAADDLRWEAAAPTLFELAPGDGHRFLFLWVRSASGQVSGRGAGTLLDTTPPPAPQGLAVAATRNPGTVTVSWAPPLDPLPGSGLAHYAIRWIPAAGGGEPAAEVTLDAGTTQTTSPALTPGEWTFAIAAVDHAGNRGPEARLGPVAVRPSLEASPAPAPAPAEPIRQPAAPAPRP